MRKRWLIVGLILLALAFGCAQAPETAKTVTPSAAPAPIEPTASPTVTPPTPAAPTPTEPIPPTVTTPAPPIEPTETAPTPSTSAPSGMAPAPATTDEITVEFIDFNTHVDVNTPITIKWHFKSALSTTTYLFKSKLYNDYASHAADNAYANESSDMAPTSQYMPQSFSATLTPSKTGMLYVRVKGVNGSKAYWSNEGSIQVTDPKASAKPAAPQPTGAFSRETVTFGMKGNASIGNPEGLLAGWNTYHDPGQPYDANKLYLNQRFNVEDNGLDSQGWSSTNVLFTIAGTDLNVFLNTKSAHPGEAYTLRVTSNWQDIPRHEAGKDLSYDIGGHSIIYFKPDKLNYQIFDFNASAAYTKVVRLTSEEDAFYISGYTYQKKQ